ncbi:HalOD1 output domain-containing protein [Natronorarus salvus]|uniref:HalOD1 output domain-containing protein n=1 Tax=Natronorarus salvus TaxID=3117733 RepID=UPI002F26D35D
MKEGRDTDAVVTFDWRSFDSPSVAVAIAVAERSGEDPLDLTPLHEVIAPESLDDLFSRPSYSHEKLNGHVEFLYYDYRVVINANGRGYLYNSTNSPSPVVLAADECAE